jgi:hypothetical protein
LFAQEKNGTSLREIKRILRRHKEMEESRRDDRLCVLGNFKGFEHTMENLKSMVRNQSQ